MASAIRERTEFNLSASQVERLPVSTSAAAAATAEVPGHLDVQVPIPACVAEPSPEPEPFAPAPEALEPAALAPAHAPPTHQASLGKQAGSLKTMASFKGKGSFKSRASSAFETLKKHVELRGDLAVWRDSVIASRMHGEILLATLNEVSSDDPDVAELAFWEKAQLRVNSEAILKQRRALRRDAQVLEMLEAHWQAVSRTMLWHRGVLPATPAPPGCSKDMWRPTLVVLARRASVAEEMRLRGAVQTTWLTKTEYMQACRLTPGGGRCQCARGLARATIASAPSPPSLDSPSPPWQHLPGEMALPLARFYLPHAPRASRLTPCASRAGHEAALPAAGERDGRRRDRGDRGE